MSTVDVTPDTSTPVSEGTDLPDGFAHIFRKADIAKFAGTGTPITALCGHTQAVSRSFVNEVEMKACERCKDILRNTLGGSPGSN